MLVRARAAWALPPARARAGWKPWALATAASLLVFADVLSTAWCRGGGIDERIAFSRTVVEAIAVPSPEDPDTPDGLDDRRMSRLARLFPAVPDRSASDVTIAKLQNRIFQQE